MTKPFSFLTLSVVSMRSVDFIVSVWDNVFWDHQMDSIIAIRLEFFMTNNLSAAEFIPLKDMFKLACIHDTYLWRN